MAAAALYCLNITREESNLPVWQQVQNNGSVSRGAINITDDSSGEDRNDLSEDTQSENFSDEENDSSDEEGEDGTDLKLREYQKELAETALTGRNSIICAPTGSGKTKVSVHIITEHLKKFGAAAKIAFFARTVPLAKQQFQTMKKHLPRSYNILLMTGGSEDCMSLHKLLDQYSVFVLTPMILVNHLCGQSPLLRGGVSVFTLLVFDECHHTREGEPYNNIMYYYLKQKRLSLPMPQVVGLTASIGVEKALTEESAKENIMKVCGNLDVDHLAIVKENIKELKITVPVPHEVQYPLVANESSEASGKILDNIGRLEKLVKHFADEGRNASVSLHVSCIPRLKKHPEYCQWVIDLQTIVKEVKIEDARRETIMAFRNINIATNYLKEYHFALESIELAQVQDVMRFLERGFVHFRNNDAKAHQEEHFYQLFEDLKEVVSRQNSSTNINLEILGKVLRKFLLDKGDETRAIIFVRTRMLAEALSSWLCRCGEDDLMRLNARKFTSTNVPEEFGGMSESEQHSVLDEFHSGEVRVLIATSVGEEGLDIPQCNLVVKYNHIGNEVSKVQTRGRSRASGGISILLGLPEILQREEMNRIRVELMEKALSEISEKSQDEFRQYVEDYQANLYHKWDSADILEEERRRRMRSVNFRVYCHLCKTVAVHSNHIRTIYGKYRVSIDRNLLDHVKIVPRKEEPMDQLLFVGSVKCLGETVPGKTCGNPIGTIIKHKKCPFITLGIKNIVFEGNGESPRTFKQWKKVTYAVEELTDDELNQYATALFT